MDHKTLDQLIHLDGRILWLGEDTASPEMRASVLNGLQRYMERLDLAPGVPRVVRESFDRLRTIYICGAFQYEFFTVVHDAACLGCVPSSGGIFGSRAFRNELGCWRLQ